MADAAKIKKHAATVLCCVEKVSSFASSIDPIFGIVSSLVGIARKGLVDEEGHPLDGDFQEINSKLESISKKNQKCLFHMGLITLMAYTSVTEDDEDEVREKWAKRVADIQAEMQRVLSQCRDMQQATS